MVLISTIGVAAVIASTTATVAPDLQLAVVFDSNLFVETGPAGERQVELQKNLWANLAIAEALLNKDGGLVQFAMVDCHRVERETLPRTLLDFAHRKEGTAAAAYLMGLTPPEQRCVLNADLIGHAIEQLAWHPQAARHILVLTLEQAMVEPGRRTFEEVTGDAVFRKITLNALTYAEDRGNRALQYVMQDIHRFMRSPSAPLGRTIHHLRQGTRWTGGHYFVSVIMEPAWGGGREILQFAPPSSKALHLKRKRERRRKRRTRYVEVHKPSRPTEAEIASVRDRIRTEWNIEAAYGPKSPLHEDALDRLASGRIRPSEVRSEDYPTFLVGEDLEPLLDVVWDFVHARESVERIISDITAGTLSEGKIPPTAGYALGQALLESPEHPPSRR